jgi:hypothetical protein
VDCHRSSFFTRAKSNHEHIFVLKFDERTPELIHSVRSVIEAYARRQRDGRCVEAA